jgi:tRNA dimethylallyltransferase
MTDNKQRLVAIVGPTAGGKTALSIVLAKALSGEIVSCDSMQLYRGMDVGTAKPTIEEMAGIPHHMIDFLDPDTSYSCADYVTDARAAIADVAARGKLPIVCGGTGLYLDSVLNGVDFGEMQPDLAYRAELLQFAQANGAQALHDRLRAIDPEAALTIHPNNIKRVARALEICHLSGMTKTEWDKNAIRNDSPYSACIIALDYKNRENLYARIHMRVDEMFKAGLESEIRTLLNAGYLSPETTAGGAIGYKELLGYIRGEMTLQEAADAIKTATRHYAKRQLTWLRRNQNVHWLYPDNDRYEDDEHLIFDAHAIIDVHRMTASNT